VAGGHDVLEKDTRRHYPRSLDNLPIALAAFDRLFLYDNTPALVPHRKVAMSEEFVPLVSLCMPERAQAAIDAMQKLRPRPHLHVIDPAERTP